MKDFIKKYINLFEILAILSLVSVGVFRHIEYVVFHGDESHWIGFSYYYNYFIGGDFDNPEWNNRWPTRFNPVITYYPIGFAREISGWGASDLNGIYNFGVSQDENLAAGNIPSPELLVISRQAIATFSILGYVIIFILLKKHSRFTAYGWVVMVLASPFFALHFRRAMNEGLLFGLVVISIWVLYLLLEHLNNSFSLNKKTLLLALLSGLLIGLTTQTKLNGGAALIGAFTSLIFLFIRLQAQAKWTILFVLLVLISVSAAAGFILPNPALWRNPIRVSYEMLDARASDLERKAENNTTIALPTLKDKIQQVGRVISQRTPFREWGMNGILFLLGSIIFGREIILWLQSGSQKHYLIAIASIGFFTSLPAFLSPIDYERYYVLPVAFGAIIILFGLEFIIESVYRQLGQVVKEINP